MRVVSLSKLIGMKMPSNFLDRTFVLALVLHNILGVKCSLLYLTVNVPIIDQTVTDKIETVIANYPKILSLSDESSVELAVRNQDWERVIDALVSFGIKYSVASEIKPCYHCEDKQSIGPRDDPSVDPSLVKWIPPRTQNLRLVYKNVLYTLIGKKACTVTVEPPEAQPPAKRSLEELQTNCVANPESNDDAWYFKSVSKSSVTCEDAETEGGVCFEYTATIHHIKYPGYGLSADKNSLVLSETPQEFLISHVNGKNFREIILQKNGSPAKTALNKSNVYIGNFFNGSVDLRVNKVHSKYDGSDLLSSFLRVKVFNLASTTSETPLKLYDTSKISGKRLLKELLVSKFIQAMFTKKDQIIVELEDDGFQYTIKENFSCSLGFTPFPHTAPFVDVTFKSTILVDVVAQDGTTVSAESLEDLHAAQFEIDTEGDLMSFLYPYTVNLLHTSESFYKLNFQPNKIMHLWKTEGDCRNYDINDMPTCVDEHLYGAGRLESNVYRRKSNINKEPFRSSIFSNEDASKDPEDLSYSYELPVTS